VTPTSSTAPGTVSATTEPTHGCARCGAPVGMGVGLCERCNPLGLRDASASQVHGTVIIAVLLAFVGLAVVARLATSGLGPFPAHLDAVVPEGDALRVTLTVTNDGSASGQTTCRVTTADNRGGGPNAFVLTPHLEPGQTITFDQVVTELGTRNTDLTVECRTP
jgi:hypothetical protein